MNKIMIREADCKGCSYCVMACPRKLISIDEGRINNLGYHPAIFTNNDTAPCTGCALCAEICPDILIEVYRQKRRASDSR